MIWSRLKNFKCPKCNAQLEHKDGKAFQCRQYGQCDFRISEFRFNEMVNDLYANRRYNPPDSYTAMPVESFTSGASDEPSEHDKFWLNKKAHE